MDMYDTGNITSTFSLMIDEIEEMVPPPAAVDVLLLKRVMLKLSQMEEEIHLQRQSAGREFYEKFIDAAAGNGIEMLTEVGYEMAARIGDLECQRDELIAENSKQLTMLLDLGRRLNIATGAIKPTAPLKVDGWSGGSHGTR